MRHRRADIKKTAAWCASHSTGAHPARPALAPFAERVANAGCRASNILSVDFARGSDAVRAARLMNAASRDEPGKRKEQCGLTSLELTAKRDSATSRDSEAASREETEARIAANRY